MNESGNHSRGSRPESKFVKELASVLPLSESPVVDIKSRARTSEELMQSLEPNLTESGVVQKLWFSPAAPVTEPVRIVSQSVPSRPELKVSIALAEKAPLVASAERRRRMGMRRTGRSSLFLLTL